MKNENKAFLIAGVVILLGVGGALAYGATQNNKDGSSSGSSSSSMSNSESSGSSDSAVSTDNAKETDTVEIANFKFMPEAITVKVGTEVTWTNNDSVKHNVVGDDLKELNGPLIGKGETYSYTFEKAGTFSYFCEPHPYMKGTVVVTE